MQGTNGYRAPELEEAVAEGRNLAGLNKEKCDVLSLGMLILQILTMRNIEGLNTFNRHAELMSIVFSLKFELARFLVRELLPLDLDIGLGLLIFVELESKFTI